MQMHLHLTLCLQYWRSVNVKSLRFYCFRMFGVLVLKLLTLIKSITVKTNALGAIWLFQFCSTIWDLCRSLLYQFFITVDIGIFSTTFFISSAFPVAKPLTFQGLIETVHFEDTLWNRSLSVFVILTPGQEWAKYVNGDMNYDTYLILWI